MLVGDAMNLNEYVFDGEEIERNTKITTYTKTCKFCAALLKEGHRRISEVKIDCLHKKSRNFPYFSKNLRLVILSRE